VVTVAPSSGVYYLELCGALIRFVEIDIRCYYTTRYNNVATQAALGCPWQHITAQQS